MDSIAQGAVYPLEECFPSFGVCTGDMVEVGASDDAVPSCWWGWGGFEGGVGGGSAAVWLES